MHSSLEPYVRKGIYIMKYVSNHPHLFRSYDFDLDFNDYVEKKESEAVLQFKKQFSKILKRKTVELNKD